MPFAPRRSFSRAALGAPLITAALLCAAPMLSAAPTPDAPPSIAAVGAPSVVTVAVEHDQDVHVVYGADDDARVIIYLHGLCGDALAGVHSWPKAASAHGTMIALSGDTPCPHSTRRRWSAGPERIAARVEAAVRAVAAGHGHGLDAARMTLVGYSEGALRAESLATKFPDRFPRLVLGGGPREPSVEGLRAVKAVATLAGERDRQDMMRHGARARSTAGLAAQFFELPAVAHGQYGPEAERVMGQVLDWVTQSAP